MQRIREQCMSIVNKDYIKYKKDIKSNKYIYKKMYDNIIIIPFRNRDTHLEYFINNTVPLIQKYLPNSKVVVIEQNEGKLFNRGMLLNIGFKEYENKTNYFYT